MSTKTYIIKREITSLQFIPSLSKSFNLYLTQELEVEPFNQWSQGFAVDYWYLEYHILKNGKIYLMDYINDLTQFVNEEKLNIIGMNLTDFENINIKCFDGNWELQIFTDSFAGKELLMSLFEPMILLEDNI